MTRRKQLLGPVSSGIEQKDGPGHDLLPISILNPTRKVVTVPIILTCGVVSS
jgi:hypothetical protein